MRQNNIYQGRERQKNWQKYQMAHYHVQCQSLACIAVYSFNVFCFCIKLQKKNSSLILVCDMTRFYKHWVLDLCHVENILIFLNIFFKFLNILKYFQKYLSIHWDLDLGQFKNSALQLRQPDQSAQQVILEIPHLCFFNQCYNEWCFWPI